MLADTCPQAANHCALFGAANHCALFGAANQCACLEFETALKFYNLGAEGLHCFQMRIFKAVTEIIDNANDRNINRFYPESARKNGLKILPGV